MQLSAAEFKHRLATGEMRLALLGMSNIGKSYLSRILAEDGFNRIDVDAQIQNALALPDMQSIAEWLGQPWESNYAEHSQTYLALETKLTLQSPPCGNTVLDTTGSVIHIDEDAQAKLKQDWFLVYLKASAADVDMLVQRYFKHPKPTIWADSFEQLGDKSTTQSLLACYPALLETRDRYYSGLADIILPAAKFENIATGDKILSLILDALRT